MKTLLLYCTKLCWILSTTIQNISGLKIGLHWHTRWNVFSHFPFRKLSLLLLLLLLLLSVWMCFAPARCLLIIKTTTARSGKALSIDRKFPQFSISTLVNYLSSFENRGLYVSIEFGCGCSCGCVCLCLTVRLLLSFVLFFLQMCWMPDIKLHSTAQLIPKIGVNRIESERVRETGKEMDWWEKDKSKVSWWLKTCKNSTSSKFTINCNQIVAMKIR